MGTRSGRRALLVLMVGAPGAGKSTLAKRLVHALDAQLIQTDRVRKQLFAEPRYSGGESAAVYGWCYNLIRTELSAGHRVVFDATNLEERGRRRAYQVADDCGARLVVVWASAPPHVVQERLLRRHSDEREVDDLSDADWNVYTLLRSQAEPIKRPHLVANTSTDLDALVQRIVRATEGFEAAAVVR